MVHFIAAVNITTNNPFPKPFFSGLHTLNLIRILEKSLNGLQIVKF